MIEPDGVRDALPVDGQCWPAAIASGPCRLQHDGFVERLPAVARLRRLDLGAGAARVPQHRDRRDGGSDRRMEGDPGWQFATQASLSCDAVDTHGRAERDAAIAARRDEDIGLAVCRRAPGHGDERAGRSNPRRRVRPTGEVERDRARTGGSARGEHYDRQGGAGERPGSPAPSEVEGESRPYLPERRPYLRQDSSNVSHRHSSASRRFPSALYVLRSALRFAFGVHVPDLVASCQKRSRSANCPLRGIAHRRHLVERGRRVGGVGPGAEVGVAGDLVHRVREVEHLGDRLESHRPARCGTSRLTRRLMLKKLVADAGVARDELAIDDRAGPAVPCTVVTPEVMLNGAAE